MSSFLDSEVQCVPNSHLMFGCNDCDCTKDGKSMICNKMGCEPMFFNHEHVLSKCILAKVVGDFYRYCSINLFLWTLQMSRWNAMLAVLLILIVTSAFVIAKEVMPCAAVPSVHTSTNWLKVSLTRDII